MFYRIPAALAVVAALTLSACESSEEQAEEFYQSGLTLLAQGDPDRAAVEFRNVFRYDGAHEDARRQLAEILLGQGKIGPAYSQYLRLAEQYPELLDVRQKLAEIAVGQQNWDEAERHGRIAIELAPDAPMSRSIRVSLDYRKAAVDGETALQAAAAAEAQTLLDEDPDDILSRRILIAQSMSQQRLSNAIELVDGAIERYPGELPYYVIKLRALELLQDDAGIESLLREMFTQFPDDTNVQQGIITFYLQRENFDAAETFLRELAGEETGPPSGFVTVIQLIDQAKGRDAAKAEIERLIAANSENSANSDFYRALMANYVFNEGDTERAIATMQDIVETAEENEQTNRLKGSLATMLLRTGNKVGSRALVEEVLEQDSTNVTALKLRAELLIDADQPSDAIVDLRRALDQSPRDSSTLLLLARAHERNGNTQLQGERLATAVDVSNAGARESLIYANFLIQNDRQSAARSVLADARNASPTNLDILALAAQLGLRENAIGLVRGIIADLERLQDQPRASDLLRSLRAALLLSEDRVDEGLSLLQQQAGAEGENARTVFTVVQTQLRAGKLDEARTYLDSLLARNASDPSLQQINAALLVAEGEVAQAEALLRNIIENDPGAEAATSQLYILLRRTGQPEAASAVVEDAINKGASSPQLLLLHAGRLEQSGDIEGAIAIYEALYARDSNSVTIANNLASLLSAFRNDEESQSRAAAVARRLRGTEVPAFQDTYGWIAYQQGEIDEALEYLEPAAEGLPDNPLVQFHLGMTYVALERTEDAVAALERAIEKAGENSTLPQIQRARDTLQDLQSN